MASSLLASQICTVKFSQIWPASVWMRMLSSSVWILSSSPNIALNNFPEQVRAGKLVLTVESPEEWQRLNAIQFGFRLRPKRRATQA